jgi:hypothetical protein
MVTLAPVKHKAAQLKWKSSENLDEECNSQSTLTPSSSR